VQGSANSLRSMWEVGWECNC